MTYGLVYRNARGETVMNADFPVPVFVASVSTFSLSITDQVQGKNVWLYRAELPAGTSAFGCMVFWSLPDTNSYRYVVRPYIGSDSLEVTIVSPASLSPPLPVAYVFSLGYASPSNDRCGMRLRDASGRVTFDSGNPHLTVMGVTGNSDSSGNVSTAGFPAAPALMLPPCAIVTWSTVQQGTRSTGQMLQQDAAWQLHGGTLNFVMEATEIQYLGSPASGVSVYGDTSFSGIPYIDTTLYS